MRSIGQRSSTRKPAGAAVGDPLAAAPRAPCLFVTDTFDPLGGFFVQEISTYDLQSIVKIVELAHIEYNFGLKVDDEKF